MFFSFLGKRSAAALGDQDKGRQKHNGNAGCSIPAVLRGATFSLKMPDLNTCEKTVSVTELLSVSAFMYFSNSLLYNR